MPIRRPSNSTGWPTTASTNFSGWDEELLGAELAGLNLNFDFNLGSLDFNLNLESFDVGGGTVGAADNGSGAPANGAKPDVFITAGDIAKTVSGLNKKEYIEVVCDQCGHHLFVDPK
jgi:hypothetical protein